MWDFHPEVGLIVAEGSSPRSKKVYLSTDFGQSHTALTDIPYGSSYVYGGCVVIVDTTTAFLAGGLSGQYHKETFSLNLNNKQWTQRPDMRYAKRYHTCSLATHGNGIKEVVIVGGYSATCYHHNEVDIYNLDTNTRRSGQNLPTRLFGHAALSYKEQVIIMGGQEGRDCRSEKGYSRTIYEYNTENDTWTRSAVELPAGSQYGSAMFLDEDICG